MLIGTFTIIQQLGVSTGGAALAVQKKKKKDKGLSDAPPAPAAVAAPVSKSMQRKLDALKVNAHCYM